VGLSRKPRFAATQRMQGRNAAGVGSCETVGINISNVYIDSEY
jgi:hypothetical protein